MIYALDGQAPEIAEGVWVAPDAVLVGRPMVVAAFGGGREGVALVLNQLKNELLQAMLLTGTADVKQVPATILHNDGR